MNWSEFDGWLHDLTGTRCTEARNTKARRHPTALEQMFLNRHRERMCYNSPLTDIDAVWGFAKQPVAIGQISGLSEYHNEFDRRIYWSLAKARAIPLIDILYDPVADDIWPQVRWRPDA